MSIFENIPISKKVESGKKYESTYSKKLKAGKRRTYFFDVRKTKGDDFYVTLTESTKRFNGEGYDRHKLFLYKEDFNRFVQSLEETISYVKTELMPDYDFDEFSKRREEEYAQYKASLEAENVSQTSVESTEESLVEETETSETEVVTDSVADTEIEDDMAW